MSQGVRKLSKETKDKIARAAVAQRARERRAAADQAEFEREALRIVTASGNPELSRSEQAHVLLELNDWAIPGRELSFAEALSIVSNCGTGARDDPEPRAEPELSLAPPQAAA